MIRLAFLLFALLMAAPVSALDLKQMSPEERAAFGAQVRSYLLENPEVIFEAVRILEARQAEAEARADFDLVTQHAQALFDDGQSWVGGNPDGDITLVEFLDYKCGYCKRAHGELAKLLESDGNIRLIVKEFPILGEQSMEASRFALATRKVAGDTAYKAVGDALMAFNGEVSSRSLRRMATSLGLNWSDIEAAMGAEDITDQIRTTRNLAQQLKISGTPTFVFQDELVRGFIPYDQMQDLIAEKRS